MDQQLYSFEEMLLDDRLGRLDPQQRPAFEAMLAADTGRRDRAARLDHLLKPLLAWTVPPASPALVDRILEEIATSAHRPFRPHPSRSERVSVAGVLGEAPDRGGGRRPFVTLREFMAIAACITLLVGVAVPAVSITRTKARQQACGTHLASLYGAVGQYASANGDALPNLGALPGQYWLNTPESHGQFRPNSAHFVLLLTQHGYLRDAQALRCPSDGRASQPAKAPRPEGLALATSYDFQNVGGATTVPLGGGVVMPIAGDANPLFMDGKFNPSLSPAQANSLIHNGRGQNVLQTDGSAGWQTSPTVKIGASRDNIWQSGNLTHYRGNEIPSSATDPFFVP